jgi:RNA polymerase sigma-70 factor (ECF subfamily)
MTVKKPASTAGFVSSVFRAYGAELQRYLARCLHHRQDAADLAQEVYLRLLRLERSELIREPHAYVYFVASQVVADFRMRASKQPVVYDSEAVEHSVEHPAELRRNEIGDRVEGEQELKRLLYKLPATHRQVLLLYRQDGLSLEEIAQELELSVHTIKKYLCHANAQIVSFKRKAP